MVGMVGKVRSISQPSATVIQEAMRLLSALGGKKETKDLLDNLAKAQEHNQQLIEQANKIIAEAEQRDKDSKNNEEESNKRIAAANADIARRSNELYQFANKLEKQQKEMEDKRKEAEVALEREVIELNTKHNASMEELVKESNALGEREEDLARREEKLRQDTNALNNTIAQYKEQTQKLNEDRKHLESFRDMLDKRDSRVRAAMEGNGDK